MKRYNYSLYNFMPSKVRKVSNLNTEHGNLWDFECQTCVIALTFLLLYGVRDAGSWYAGGCQAYKRCELSVMVQCGVIHFRLHSFHTFCHLLFTVKYKKEDVICTPFCLVRHKMNELLSCCEISTDLTNLIVGLVQGV